MVHDRDWFIGLVKKIATFGTQRRKEFLAHLFSCNPVKDYCSTWR
jgi:hypothetical protein